MPDFIADVRAMNIAPHVSPNADRCRRVRDTKQSAVDGRTTRHPGDVISQGKRKLVEHGFGWEKCVGLLRKLHHRGRKSVRFIFAFTRAAYTLVRLRTLLMVPAT